MEKAALPSSLHMATILGEYSLDSWRIVHSLRLHAVEFQHTFLVGDRRNLHSSLSDETGILEPLWAVTICRYTPSLGEGSLTLIRIIVSKNVGRRAT